MSKANETKLSNLHGKVAEVLIAQLSHTEAEVSYDADGIAVETGEELFTASPATIAASIKFLKDNQITCDIEQDENMNNLRDTLNKKQKHSRLTDAKQAALRVVGE